MTEMYISQLNERNEKDGAVLNEALQDLQGMVKNQRKSREVRPLMERRLPNRKISPKEFIVFAAKSLSAGDLIYVFVISVAVTLLGMLAPFLNKQIFDGIIPSGEVGNLIPITFVLAAAGIGNIMFSISKSLVLMRLRDKVNIDVQAAILDRTFTMPASFYKEYGAGNLGSRVLTVSRICELLSNTVVGGMLSLLFSLVYLAQVFIYAKSMMGICVLLIFLNIALQFLGYSANKRFSQKIQSAGVELNGFLYSLINGIQKIKTSGAEKRAFARWAGFFKNASPDQAGKPLIILLMPALSMLLSLGGTLLIYNKAFVSGIPLSDYIAFTVAFGMVSGAISTFCSILPSLSSLEPMFELIKPILETEPEVEDDFREVDFLTGSIEINNLKFRYSEDSPYIYDGLNLKIKAGEYVAIVGNSGCGKSTLMRLLLGFEKPESGTIFYDQYNLAKINKQSLRQHIGTCMQEKNLFGGSILDNITITAPMSTMEEVWEAARMADIADDIEAMPMKMHTLINDSGSGLSGGQKQRVLIARALIGKPSILFMDEATSALDNLSQERVVENLAKTKCTRVCIAHRTSTVISCDRILVLDKGKIIEEGTYEQLMEQKGFFYELSKRQL